MLLLEEKEKLNKICIESRKNMLSISTRNVFSFYRNKKMKINLKKFVYSFIREVRLVVSVVMFLTHF